MAEELLAHEKAQLRRIARKELARPGQDDEEGAERMLAAFRQALPGASDEALLAFAQQEHARWVRALRRNVAESLQWARVLWRLKRLGRDPLPEEIGQLLEQASGPFEAGEPEDLLAALRQDHPDMTPWLRLEYVRAVEEHKRAHKRAHKREQDPEGGHDQAPRPR